MAVINYSENIVPFAVGRRVNMEEWNGVTGVFEAANDTAQLAFGVPVIPGTNEGQVVRLSAAGQNVLGITEASQVLYHPGDYFLRYDNVGVCESGVIGVLLGANVTKGAQARFNTANGTWTGAAASSTVLTIPGAQFDEAGTSGAVGVVRYRRPVPSVATGA